MGTQSEGNGKTNHPDEREPFFSAFEGTSVERPGTQIGRFKLLSVLGEGGYGIVYLAEQQRPMRRRVALKIIKPGMDSKEVLSRFESERQALALLDHAHIAQVFTSGATDAGRPYFVMEYVDGLPITEYSDQHQLNIEDRLRLFQQVCGAVQHAHQKGIIHRDLKPSNILVSTQNDLPVAKIIDFGVARATSQPLTDRTLYTDRGQMVGTPEYMSPEQADMAFEGIDTRSDVYSMGAVLYELLTGTLPFDPETLRQGGAEGMRKTIRDQEPFTPSTRLSSLGNAAKTIAEQRNTEVFTLTRQLHRELEWIPLKALRKDRTRRYQSATELAQDIQNYLEGAPLLAGPESVTYKLCKFARRYRVYAVAGFVVMLTICLAMAVITKFYLDARKLAEAQRRTLYFKNISLVDGIYKNQPLSGANSLLASCPDDLKGWEWDRLQYILDESLYTIRGHSDVIDGLARSQDGKHIWSCSRDKTIRCWNLDTGQEIQKLIDPCTPMTICLNHSETHIVTGDQVGNISIWDTNTGQKIASWPGRKKAIRTLSFDCHDSHLLSISEDQLLIWDVKSGQPLMELQCNGSYGGKADWSPDGDQIAVIQGDRVLFFDVKCGQEVGQLRIHDPWCDKIRFSPNGSTIVVCGTRIWLYDVHTGSLEGALPGSKENITSMELSPDGRYLVTGDEKGFIQVWDLSSLTEVVTLRGHAFEVLDVVFSANGKRILSSGLEAIKVWDAETDSKYLDLIGHQVVCSIAFSPDSRRLVSASQDKTLKVWDLASGSEVLTLCGHEGKVWSAAFTSDGTKIISGSDDKTVRVWDAHTGDMLAILAGHEGAVLSVTSSPDNQWIVSASVDHKIKLWNMDSGKEVRTFLGHEDAVTCVAFNADGSCVASGGLDHTVRIWDVSTGRTVAMWSDADLLRANSIAFGPDGTLLLSGTSSQKSDRTFRAHRKSRMARFWGSIKGQESYGLIWYPQANCLSPDGTRVVYRWPLDVEVRDSITGDLSLTLRPRCSWYGSAVFSPDGRTLSTSGYWGGIGIYESGPPSGGYQIRKAAQAARILVDKLHEELKSYRSVIESIQGDQSLDESIRQFALQISRSRLTAEQYSEDQK